MISLRSRAVAEYLAALDVADAEDSGDGGGNRKPPKQSSSWVAWKKMSPFFAYDAKYLIDNKLDISVSGESLLGAKVRMRTRSCECGTDHWGPSGVNKKKPKRSWR